MATSSTEVISRQSPEMEAYNLGLLDLAKKRTQTPVNLPNQQVAAMTGDQQTGIGLARSGLGSYQPYMSQAMNNLNQSSGLFNQVPGIANNFANTAMGFANQGQNMIYNPAAQGNAQGTAAGYAGAQGYDPNGIGAFMNPYQQLVTQQNLSELDRQANGLRQQNDANAVKAGAFGGSRDGIVRSETERNLMDQKSRMIAQDNANNFNQAQNASINTFQNQQARMQQAGLMSLQGGQMQSQAGQSALGLGAQTAINSGQLSSGAALDSARGIGSLATTAGQLGGLQQAYGQADASFIYNMGANEQKQNQAQLNADYTNQLNKQYEPFQRIGWYSDILHGTPSANSTVTNASTPDPSMANQLIGAGIAGYGAINAFNQANKSFGS